MPSRSGSIAPTAYLQAGGSWRYGLAHVPLVPLWERGLRHDSIARSPDTRRPRPAGSIGRGTGERMAG
mgnify:CR=1 FL=1